MTIALGAMLGVIVALLLEGIDLASLVEPVGDYLLPPLITAVNAGISCF